ncbi:hypothetical protein [Nostoc sp.]|uniref:hypothetical protein n=1 Tax=Nostoc sp. TaxID=1180 RepID=UPI002FFCDB05
MSKAYSPLSHRSLRQIGVNILPKRRSPLRENVTGAEYQSQSRRVVKPAVGASATPRTT